MSNFCLGICTENLLVECEWKPFLLLLVRHDVFDAHKEHSLVESHWTFTKMRVRPENIHGVMIEELPLLAKSECDIALSVPVFKLLSSGHFIELVTIHQAWVALHEGTSVYQSLMHCGF